MNTYVITWLEADSAIVGQETIQADNLLAAMTLATTMLEDSMGCDGAPAVVQCTVMLEDQ